MSRNKYPEETVKKILEVSFELFSTKGYEKTSIQDIVDHLGMSKGAIYHHFKSKEDILSRLCDRVYNDMSWFHEIQEDPQWNGLEKLRRLFIHELENERKVSMDIVSMSMQSDPHILMESMRSSVEDIAPIISHIMEEGIRDGSIRVSRPRETSEALIILINIWVNPHMFLVEKERFIDKIQFMKELLEGLGLPLVNDAVYEVILHYYDVICQSASKS